MLKLRLSPPILFSLRVRWSNDDYKDYVTRTVQNDLRVYCDCGKLIKPFFDQLRMYCISWNDSSRDSLRPIVKRNDSREFRNVKLSGVLGYP